MRWIVRIFLVLMAITAAAPVRADESWLTTFAGLKQEYTDNLFFDVRGTTEDFISTVLSGVDAHRKTERIDINFKGEIDPRFYVHHSSLNSADQSYVGSGRYRVTPRFSIAGDAGYLIDSRPDRDIEVTGLVLSTATRYRQQYGANAEYVLSEKDSLTLGLSYWKDHFGPSTLIDTEANTTTLTALHDLTSVMRATKGRVQLSYGTYRFGDEASSEVRDFTGMVGATRAVNEVWSWSLDGGARHTTSKFEDARVDGDSGWGAVGQTAFSYRGERMTVDLSAGHVLLPASGRAGATNRTFLTVSGTRRLTYELRVNLTVEYFLNKASAREFGSQRVDEETLRFSPGIRYEFNPETAIEASYGFTRVNYRVNDRTATRNLIMARLLYRHKVFE